jgi:hypothetical protein
MGEGVAWPPDWQPTGDAPPLPGWIAPAMTDSQGRFVIHGVNRRDTVSLTVADQRFAPWRFYIEPLGKKPPGELEKQRDASARDGEHIYPRDLSQVVTLVPPPAQIIEGRVLYSNGGTPAAHAQLTVYSCNGPSGRLGSSVGICGQTDAEGRFRLSPYPSEFFGLTAYPAEAQPYLILKKELTWPNGADSLKIEITLPRGILVRGKISESPSGKPVNRASIQYHSCSGNPNLSEDVVTQWQGIVLSDSAGTFQIAVPAGRGTLLIHGPTPDYIAQVVGSEALNSGEPKPGGIRNYVGAALHLDLPPDAPTQEVTATLRRGVTVKGRVLDPQGRSLQEVLMLSRQYVASESPEWRAWPIIVRGGEFELPGCDPEKGTTTYFLDPGHQWGASVELSGRSTEQPVVVRLHPCGSASVRFVDFQGKPIAGLEAMLEVVMTPGLGKYSRGLLRRVKTGQWVADEDSIANFDRKHYWLSGLVSDHDGRCTFPCLVPGAIYRLYDNKGHTINDVARDFSVKTGEQLQLPDIVMEHPQPLPVGRHASGEGLRPE